MRLHFLALGQTGFGEVTLALRIAADAREAGHTCSFTVPAGLVGHVQGCGFEALTDPGGVGDAALAALEVHTAGADQRILVDLNLTGAALLGRQLHPQQLLVGSPVVGIDTWHYPELGSHIDLAAGVRIPIEPVWRDLPRRIVPVPFVRPEAPLACNLLPLTRVSAAERRARREELGVRGKLVVVCTSWWQHRLLDSPQGRPVAELLGLYLARLDADVVHIGPADLPWSRTQRLDSLPVPQFERTLAAADLVLSLNASATSNTTALSLDVPVLTVWNRWSARGTELAFKLGYAPSPELRGWLASNAPVPRFAMWPMDWTEVLSTLLANNPYAAHLGCVDLLDERRFHAVATGLLHDPQAQEAARSARQRCVEATTVLPRPSELLARFSGSGSA